MGNSNKGTRRPTARRRFTDCSRPHDDFWPFAPLAAREDIIWRRFPFDLVKAHLGEIARLVNRGKCTGYLLVRVWDIVSLYQEVAAEKIPTPAAIRRDARALARAARALFDAAHREPMLGIWLEAHSDREAWAAVLTRSEIDEVAALSDKIATVIPRILERKHHNGRVPKRALQWLIDQIVKFYEEFTGRKAEVKRHDGDSFGQGGVRFTGDIIDLARIVIRIANTPAGGGKIPADSAIGRRIERCLEARNKDQLNQKSRFREGSLGF
jgi:hypothetical protein